MRQVGAYWIGYRLQVIVRDNNVDQALKALKKKMQREGIFREMKRRSFYEKPSEKRVREKAEGVRRARKQARKRACSARTASPRLLIESALATPHCEWCVTA
jgi:small subunit ribosomal protein S21